MSKTALQPIVVYVEPAVAARFRELCGDTPVSAVLRRHILEVIADQELFERGVRGIRRRA